MNTRRFRCDQVFNRSDNSARFQSWRGSEHPLRCLLIDFGFEGVHRIVLSRRQVSIRTSRLAYFHLTLSSFYDGPYPSQSLELLDNGLGEIRGRGGSLDVPRLELAIVDDLVDCRGDRVGLLVQTEVSQQHARREDHGG
jgi:hypothetical protein